jgi:hypothetical protein
MVLTAFTSQAAILKTAIRKSRARVRSVETPWCFIGFQML